MGFVTKDTVALITGGSKGIGKAIAAEILKQGGSVVLVDIDNIAGEASLKEFQSQYGQDRALFCQCDVTNDAEFAGAFRKCLDKYGHLDIAVNNAGIGDRVQLTDDSAKGDPFPADWRKIIDVNLTAVLNGTRLAYHAMVKNPQPNGGVILNIGSLGSFLGQPYSAVYSATKHAVLGHVRSLGHLKKNGVRVVGLAPGFTATNLVETGTKESPIFRSMIKQATKHSGGLLPTEAVVQGAFMLFDNPAYAGQVISVSRELGYALHDTPHIFPKKDAEVSRHIAIPHKSLGKIQSNL